MNLDPRVRAWRWRVFAATWLSYAGFYFCRKPFFIAKGTIGDELNWTSGDLKWVGAAWLIAYAAGQFLGGIGGNLFGPRLLLLIGMSITLVSNIVFGATNSLNTFATFMVINGLAQATGWSNNVGMMGNWFARSERGTVMGIWATNYQFGGIAANAIAAWMLGNCGWRWSFFAGSVVMLVVLAFFSFTSADSPQKLGLPAVQDVPDGVTSDDSGWTKRLILNVAIMGVFYFFVKFIRYALWSWAPYILENFYNLPGDEAGYLSTIFDVAGVFGVFAIGWLSDHYFSGRRTSVSFLFILAMTASCLLLWLTGQSSLGMFAICLALVGFTLYGPDALMTGAGAIDVGSPRTAPLAAGIINGMGSIGSIVQELILGDILKDTSAVRTTFALILLSSTLAAVCLTVLVWRNQSGEADI